MGREMKEDACLFTEIVACFGDSSRYVLLNDQVRVKVTASLLSTTLFSEMELSDLFLF